VYPDHGPGPMEALDDFLATRTDFEIDESREKFFLTFNPRGYLRYTGERPVEAPRDASAIASATNLPRWKHGYNFDCGSSRDSVQTRTLRLVGEGKRVLDIGCGPGIKAKYLKAQNCTVVGVEVDRDAAAEASQWCERVIVGDLERPNWQYDLGGDVFDVIAVNDVLEHLQDPVGCLRDLRRFVDREGCVIASIPNIAHGSIRLTLLAGDFRYRDLGILDRTHLRFFTRRTIEELFDDAGYAIKTIERVELPFDGTEIEIPAGLPAELSEWLSADEEARTYQFIVVAVPIRHGAETALRDRVRALSAENEELRVQLQTLALPASIDGADDADIENDVVRRRFLQLRAQVLDLRRQLAQRSTQFASLQNEFLSRRTPSAEIENVLKARDEEIVALNAYVARQSEEAARYATSLNDALLQKDEELRRLYGRVNELGAESAEVSKLRDALAAMRAELLARESAMQEREAAAAAAVDQLRDAIAERDVLIESAESRAREEAKAHGAQSQMVEDALRQKDEQLRHKDGRLLQKQNELLEKQSELQRKEQELRQKQNDLDAIHSSKLWKVGSLYWRLTKSGR
jgi:2-polyprenyl-3-methyl-5-hydroxy-6-metoxy-1,4-benzoquinol methylase